MPPLLPIGSSLRNRYRIVNALSQTRFSNLYVAQDDHLTSRYWVIKEIGIYGMSPGDRSKMSQLFQAESYQISALEHVCIPKLIDYFCQSQCLYIVREFIPGNDLASLIESRILPETEIINIGLQLCDLCIYLQSKNFTASLYTNLKLSNIVMRSDGHISILDIGYLNINNIIRNEQELAQEYVPPETFTGAFSSESKMLIYIIGSIIYHLFTGLNPSVSTFNLPPIETIRQDICPASRAAAERALKNDPRDRFSSIGDLQSSLTKAFQISAKRSGHKNAMPTITDRNDGGSSSWLWIVILLIVFLIGGAVFVLYQMYLK
ncbi:protein kinase [bacterium]|nr:protein kinase [bacterium]